MNHAAAYGVLPIEKLDIFINDNCRLNDTYSGIQYLSILLLFNFFCVGMTFSNVFSNFFRLLVTEK